MYQRGDAIGDYVVENQIGEGAVAVVFRVRHRQRGTIHALKLLCTNLPSARERLVVEGRMQARLDHPNVVKVSDIVKADDALGLVMEYVSGPSLDDWLKRNEPELSEALDLFAGMVRAVALVHANGVVHRDIKPGNFLIASTDRGTLAKLTDFGLIRVLEPADASRRYTLTGAFLGSPAYMAPEQVRDPRDVDTRADLWSLGCVLYELVCHRRAFVGSDQLEVANKVVEGRFVPAEEVAPHLPERVVRTLHGLLQVDVAQRIESCQALWSALYGDERGELTTDANLLAVELDLEPPSVVGDTFFLSRSLVLRRSGAGAGLLSTSPYVALAASCALLALVAAVWWVVG